MNSEKEIFILAHGFRGVSPLSAGIAFQGPSSAETAWWEDVGDQTCSPMLAKEQSERNLEGKRTENKI